MYMPDSCRECWFCKFDSNTGSTECVIGENILARYFESLNFEGRHEECPLIDVPDIHFGNISEFSNSSTDCISRQAAIDALCSVCGVDCDKSKFVYGGKQEDQVILCPEHYALTQLPSTQPEIIRCRDCVYSHMTYNTYSGECKYCDMWRQIYESGESLYLEGDFFCAFGKKKETNGSDGDK